MKHRERHTYTHNTQAGNMVTEAALMTTLLVMIVVSAALTVNTVLTTIRDTYKLEVGTETTEVYTVQDLHPIEDLLNETITQLEDLSNGQ